MTELADSDGRSHACVYVYRRLDGIIVYVGRGLTPDRAQSHAGGSHNAALSELIATGEYELKIAGPYDPYEVAMEVEAAIIAALTRPGTHDLMNRVSGTGHRFAPLGVPTKLAERPLLSPLKVTDLGLLTSGVLIVRNRFGEDLEPGRPRLDPMRIDQNVLVENIRRYWLIERLRPDWIADPASAPKVVVAAAGPLKRRYVPTSVFLDSGSSGDVPMQELPLDIERHRTWMPARSVGGSSRTRSSPRCMTTTSSESMRLEQPGGRSPPMAFRSELSVVTDKNERCRSRAPPVRERFIGL